jgi:protein-tyrosine-phosphatase
VNKRNPKKQVPNLLFVCYGNTCRSPMAEGLAKKLLGDGARIESAGISPIFDIAQEKAVEVMQELFDVDISGHQPRHIKDVSPDKFDFVIALDKLVHLGLQKHYKIANEKLILWEINDPFSQNLKAYRDCAEKIHRCLQEFLDEII